MKQQTTALLSKLSSSWLEIKNTRTLISSMLVCCSLSSLTYGADTFERPNIVLMLSDNLGFGDLGSYGGGQTRGAPTPNLDRLAAQGIRFTNFNVESECTPSRAALMTGRLPIRSGNDRAIPLPGLPAGLPSYEITLAETLKKSGYDTAIFGKWHLGYKPERLPNTQGFDQWWGFSFSTGVTLFPDAVGFDSSLFPSPQLMSASPATGVQVLEPYTKANRPMIDTTIAKKSVEYIEQHANSDKPFFLYIPWSLPHHPSIAHPDFQGRSGAGRYGDAVIEHDHHVGQVMAALDQAGISDNTLVIYASDNGPDRTEYPYVADTGPFRGFLGSVHEGSIRTPMMMRWPKKISPKVSNEIVAISDFFPTISALVGAELPKDRTIDGIDQSEFFFGQQDKSNRESVLFFAAGRLTAVKWRQFKIYLNSDSTEREARDLNSLWIPRAYNLLLDPKEQHDIALENLWLLSPALKPMLEYFQSVKQHGLILPGGDKPEVFDIRKPPFMESESFDLVLQAMQKTP